MPGPTRSFCPPACTDWRNGQLHRQRQFRQRRRRHFFQSGQTDQLHDQRYTSGGHNLIGDGSGAAGFVNGVNGDIVGTADNPIDPGLAPLRKTAVPPKHTPCCQAVLRSTEATTPERPSPTSAASTGPATATATGAGSSISERSRARDGITIPLMRLRQGRSGRDSSP